MNWSNWVRRIHRWVSVAFTAAFIFVAIAALGGEAPAEWVYLLPLLPLSLLLITGLYLFALPYVRRWRNADGTSEGGSAPPMNAP